MICQIILWKDGDIIKNKIIKNMALNIAIFQLFSTQILNHKQKGNIDSYSLQTKIISPVKEIKPNSDGNRFLSLANNDTISKYTEQLIDENLEHVSIFDYENINSRQYGANQNDFKTNFNNLINDPEIWNEMQYYFPINAFETEYEAMFVYRKYFDLISDCGCGYAAATNFIFRLFEGKEEEFYETFGFPMYTQKNNYIDFNYEILMLNFFNYHNLMLNKSCDLIFKSMEREYYDFKLKEYSNNNISKLNREEIANWTELDWNNWYDKAHEIEKKKEELRNKISSTKPVDVNLGITIEPKFGNIKSFLANYGVNINTKLKYSLGTPAVDEIIASDDFTLYEVDKNGSIHGGKNIDLHYVYISEINDDGNIIVSSWGKMYIFDDKNSESTQKIILKLSK